jgi:hypothetical protein
LHGTVGLPQVGSDVDDLDGFDPAAFNKGLAATTWLWIAR